MAQSKPRNGLIDVMRGLCIVIVLIHHFDIAYGLDKGFFATLFSAKVVHAVARNGNYAVTVFFAISGYLITSMSLSRFGELKNVSLRQFYSFRFARIVPNIALILAIVVPLALAGVRIFANRPGTASLGITVLSIVTFTHNLLMQKYEWFNYCLNILWSLSVEEMFYFTFPLACIFLRKETLLIVLWAAVAIFAPIHRAHYRNDEIVSMLGYWSCFDAIAIGCMAAVLSGRVRWSDTTRKLTRYIAAAVIVGVYLYKGIGGNVVWGVSLMALSTGLILLGVQDEASLAESSSNIASRILHWFGRNSYELYVFHIVVLAVMRIAVKRDALGYYAKPLWFALFMVLSAMLGGVISHFYSEPLNRRLRKMLSPTNVSREADVATPALV